MQLYLLKVDVLHDTQQTQQILSLHSKRTLSKNLTYQYNNVPYQIQTQTKGYRLRQSTMTVIESFDSTITLLSKGKSLDYRTYALGEQPAIITDEKGINVVVDQIKRQQLAKPAILGTVYLLIDIKLNYSTTLFRPFAQ